MQTMLRLSFNQEKSFSNLFAIQAAAESMSEEWQFRKLDQIRHNQERSTPFGFQQVLQCGRCCVCLSIKRKAYRRIDFTCNRVRSIWLDCSPRQEGTGPNNLKDHFLRDSFRYIGTLEGSFGIDTRIRAGIGAFVAMKDIFFNKRSV
jgi:hypothetical protein